MAAKACAQDDVRYATDAEKCPQCGSTEAYEAGSPEHLAALEVAARVGETPVELDEADRVPGGTTEEIRAWVGDDRERAARALAVERAGAKPRTTLVDHLAKLAEDQADEGDS